MIDRAALYGRRAVNRLFKHRYTAQAQKQNITGTPTKDVWGHLQYDTESRIYNEPCLLIVRETSVSGNDGASVTHEPTLYVPYFTEIAVGDEVQTVKDQDNVTLLESARVLTVNTKAAFGLSICKVATLSGATSRGL